MGQQSALNGPAVLCSFSCPSAHRAAGLCQKEGQAQPHYGAHTDKACFCEGFHSEVTNRLQDSWEDHML